MCFLEVGIDFITVIISHIGGLQLQRCAYVKNHNWIYGFPILTRKTVCTNTARGKRSGEGTRKLAKNDFLDDSSPGNHVKNDLFAYTLYTEFSIPKHSWPSWTTLCNIKCTFLLNSVSEHLMFQKCPYWNGFIRVRTSINSQNSKIPK